MRFLHRAAMAAAALLAATTLAADETPLAWANGLRGHSDPAAVPLRHDALLSAVAGAYAAELAAAGVLDHVSPVDGSRTLDRFFRAGGTAFEVGEILGAGPDLALIERAWEASPTHRVAVLNDRYTHIGWGMAHRDAQQVWVVMLARTAVEGLSLEEREGVLAVRGALGPAWAVEPWLDAGSGSLAPSAWDASTRRFEFNVPLEGGSARFLLGCRDRFGDRQATDSVTWPRGTAWPAGAARSSAPAQPP